MTKRFALLIAVSVGIGGGAEPPQLRLSKHIVPELYSVDLTLDPAKEDFQGEIHIALRVNQASSLLWLKSTGLTIDKATVDSKGTKMDGKIEEGGEDFVGFSWPKPLAPGAAMLHVAYHGKVSTKSSDGIFRVTQDGSNYIFTQFESISARRAFPCFDEPAFKVP